MGTATAMTAALPPEIEAIDDRYVVYRVIEDYEALQDGFIERIEDLNTVHSEIDAAGGLLAGYTGKTMCKPPMKKFGWDSLGKTLKGTGMALLLVIDNRRIDQLRQLAPRKMKRRPPIAGMRKPRWLFSKKKAFEMGKRRFSLMSEKEKKRHQRKAAKARWAKVRRDARAESVALAAARAAKARGFDPVRDASSAGMSTVQAFDCAK
jgi:hypothetical protein